MSDYEPPMPIMKAVAASISQNTEQNVRTQSLQIAEIVERVTDLSLVNCYPEFGEVQDWMIEAEARGAEEQRRKDAEGQEQTYYVREDSLRAPGSLPFIHAALWKEPISRGGCFIALSTRPANVTALEARIAELEKQIVLECRLSNLRAECVERWTDTSAQQAQEIDALKEAEQLARADAEASKAREDALQKALQEIVSMAEADCSYDTGPYLRTARAALTREGGV